MDLHHFVQLAAKHQLCHLKFHLKTQNKRHYLMRIELEMEQAIALARVLF